MKKRILALLLVLALAACLFAGCSKTETPAPEATEAAAPAAEEAAPAEAQEAPAEAPAEAPVQAAAPDTSAPPEPAEVAEEAAISYPLSGDDEITMWATIMGLYAGYVDDWNDASMVAAADEATGVHLEVDTVNDQTATEQFNLMIAAGDWDDLINVGSNYSGGQAQAYEDEVIIEMTEEAMQENMPNYWSYLSALDYATLEVVKESDMFLGMTSISNTTFTDRGLVCRGDWLDALGCDMPTTRQELTDLLYKVKETYDPLYTLKTDDGSLQYARAAFNTHTLGYEASSLDLYLIDDTITTPYVTEEYYDYVKWIAQLYADGLIYKDFYNESGVTNTTRFTNIVNDEVFMFEDRADGINDYKSFMTAESDPNMRMQAVAPLVDDSGKNTWGDEATLAQGNGISITCDCENPEFVMQYMNYFWTEDGIMLANYGEEGVSWTMGADGEPQWTDVILNNEQGLNLNNAGTIYCMGSLLPTLSYADKFFSAYAPEVQEAIALYSDDSITAEHAVPNGAGLTTEEQDSITNSVSDICTYVEEHLLKFMTGAEELNDESWAGFVDALYGFGMEDVLAIYQNAYDEYVAGDRFITSSAGMGGGPGGDMGGGEGGGDMGGDPGAAGGDMGGEMPPA